VKILYGLKTKTGGTLCRRPSIGNPNAEVSVNQAIKDGFKPEVNAKEVAMRPTDMPNSGFVNKVR
jgi:hypothetical protein